MSTSSTNFPPRPQSIITTDLSKHIALVTGGTGGIGSATCRTLAALGCTIAVHFHTNENAATSLVAELERMGVRAHAFQADLSRYEGVKKLHDEVTTALGNPTILFNNAGITAGKAGIKSIHDITPAEFEHTWRANCGTAFYLTQLCLPAMEEAGWGRVIFCSSAAAFTGGVVGPHYASSKSALHGLIHWLSSAYCSKGITVNGVAPALIEHTTMLPGGSNELKAKIPLGRLGQPEEIAETVLWMVKTGYLTNKLICLDGGMVAR